MSTDWLEVTQALLEQPEATRIPVHPGSLMKGRHGFQEARAVAPRTVRSAMLLGLALELHSGQPCAAPRTLPLLQTNRNVEMA